MIKTTTTRLSYLILWLSFNNNVKMVGQVVYRLHRLFSNHFSVSGRSLRRLYRHAL